MVAFEKEVIKTHHQFRKGLSQIFKDSMLLNIITSPIIYSLLIPIILTDFWVTFYQHICFRVYGIPRVNRSAYIVIDRHHLSYLNIIEAMNCAFCAYANGVVAYAREISSRTEQYWCPIKHALRIRDPHERYFKFLDYGDAQGFREKLENYRKKMENPKD